MEAQIYDHDYSDVTFLQLYPQIRRQTMSMPTWEILAPLRVLGVLGGMKKRGTAKDPKEREEKNTSIYK
jgi:hypothetical protein